MSEMITELSQAWDSSDLFRIIVALVIPVIAWFVRTPLANLALQVFKVMAKKIGVAVSEQTELSLAPTTKMLVVALGAVIANRIIRMPDPYFGIVQNVLVSICVIAVFTILYGMCRYIRELFSASKKIHTTGHISLVVRVAQSIVVIVGVAVVLKVWGIDIGPALAGMGLAGAAVALAAQDYLKNLIAGFNNAAEHRFREGDWIRVDGLIEGTVESVDLRSTLVRRFDLAPVTVPNSELANAALANFSRCRYRRIFWKVALTYSCSIDSLRQIRDGIEKYIDDSDHFVSPDLAARYVRIDSLNESSIDILVLCFTRSNVWADYLEAKEDLVLAIKSIVNEVGGAFAFPSRSIYVEASANTSPDQFVGIESEPQATQD